MNDTILIMNFNLSNLSTTQIRTFYNIGYTASLDTQKLFFTKILLDNLIGFVFFSLCLFFLWYFIVKKIETKVYLRFAINILNFISMILVVIMSFFVSENILSLLLLIPLMMFFLMEIYENMSLFDKIKKFNL